MAEQDQALEYATTIKDGIVAKAGENKRLTTVLFFTVIAATAFSPVLILLPLDPLYSKILPALFTACAGFAAGWIQLRKPQERWAIYRTAHREIEFEIDQYRFGNGRYSEPTTKASLLTDAVSQRALRLHFEWLPFVPRAEQLEKLGPKKERTKNVVSTRK